MQALYKELDKRKPTAGRRTSPSVTADTITSASGMGQSSGDAQLPAAPRDDDVTGTAVDQSESASFNAAPEPAAGQRSEPKPAVHWWEQPASDQVRSY